MKKYVPYKDHMIIVDAYQSPPDGWRYSLVIRSPGNQPVKDGADPGTAAYPSEEEAFESGTKLGKSVIDLQ